jgi:hypothetical protein
MKTILLFSVLLTLFSSCEKEKIILESKAPSQIKSYISEHFSGFEIVQIVEDRDGFELTYDVWLEGSYFLEFNRKKEIKEVSGLNELPDSVLPVELLLFVKTNYSDSYVSGWELDDRNQNLKLNNGLDLVFNKQGNFLRIDD